MEQATEFATEVALQYAQAMLELAEQQDLADTVRQELAELASAAGAVPGLSEFLASPVIPWERKQQVLAEPLSGKASQLTLNFLAVLLRNRRGELLGEVAQQYARLQDTRAGKVEVTVMTAVPLDDDLRCRLAEVLREVLDAEPVLHTQVEPSVLGGLRVQMGDRVMDLSLASALERLREGLLTAPPDMLAGRAAER